MAQYSTSGGPVRGSQITLKASGAEAASTVGPAVSTGPDSGSLFLNVNVASGSGGTTTLLVKIEGSMDGTNWFTLGTVGANGYNVGSVGVTAPTNFTGAAANTLAIYDAPMYVRYNSTVGAGATFTYSVTGTVGL